MGGRQGLEDLYRAHAPSMKRLAYLITGDEGLAEDVTQDAFIRIFRRFGDLREEAFPGYLRRTVVNLCIDAGRRERRVRKRLDDLASATATEIAPPDERSVSHDEMRTALMKLAPRQRAVLVLRFYEDMSDLQIAEVLSCSVGTVKGYGSRGMQALREGWQR